MKGRDAANGGMGAASGSALIVALWIVSLLSMLVGAFAFDAHVEARITSFYRKRTKSEYLARSGLEIARMLMKKSGEVSKDDPDELGDSDRWFDPAKRLSQGLAIRGLSEQLGEGTVTVDIVPEPARRNVNLLKEDDWERIFEVVNIPEDLWPELIDSFLDWIDKDEEPRIDGAETEDYYTTLETPYLAKNGPLDTVGELRYVKAFIPAIIYGGVIETGFEDEEPVRTPGIQHLLTIHGDGKVNINAASREVLMTLPGIDELAANDIIDQREGWTGESGVREESSFDSVDDLMARVWGLEPSLREYVSTDSKIYRVTSVGNVHGVQRRVWATVEYSGDKQRILTWREED